MSKILKFLFCLIIVDFFFFSTTMSFTRGYNTKEILAVVGIFLFLNDMYRQKQLAVSNEFVGLLIYSGIISLAAVLTTVVHNTQESLYTTYFLSMLVWLSAAFVVIKCLKGVYGKITIEIVAMYIVIIAVIQGLIAVIADNYAPLDNFILRTIPSLSWSKSVDRLYGFGSTATLDTGGIRFAIASVLCAHNIKSLVNENRIIGVPFYILAFLIISVTGNMVARTTIVGTIIGLVYLFIYISPFKKALNTTTLKAWLWVIMETLAVVIIVASLYNSDPKFYSRTRFAFEGFFSLVENGRWQTGSNDKLVSMYVFPENPETWLIGDGYFMVQGDDPYYMGEAMDGYYMGTDVGYLRFIFYFGLLGLVLYSCFIIYAGRVCNRLLPGNMLLFIVLTSMTFIIWFKVATDCFFVLCLFICLGYVKNNMEKVKEIEE